MRCLYKVRLMLWGAGRAPGPRAGDRPTPTERTEHPWHQASRSTVGRPNVYAGIARCATKGGRGGQTRDRGPTGDHGARTAPQRPRPKDQGQGSTGQGHVPIFSHGPH